MRSSFLAIHALVLDACISSCSGSALALALVLVVQLLAVAWSLIHCLNCFRLERLECASRTDSYSLSVDLATAHSLMNRSSSRDQQSPIVSRYPARYDVTKGSFQPEILRPSRRKVLTSAFRARPSLKGCRPGKRVSLSINVQCFPLSPQIMSFCRSGVKNPARCRRAVWTPSSLTSSSC